ncbi:hypothetical protein QGN32_18120 [Mycolicibacterium sp. ND9-15]|uniref:hypothetical protein n=1 Tax=Mycolicibacterium sp. ND9-15 TaxID=3042320 RepID=UPI002DD85F8E|nr:hypothetical protein [Mycolicibacterium sp. ND9-15]WSE55339.1 hypothetical protein QGN32_18120 [Mycolicibacterium sp. ND9-15]
MWDAARSFVAEHRDLSKLVEEGQRFSVRVPVLGRVGVPRPDQLAFYAALGVLAAAQVIDWPVALLIGVGHAVAMRNVGHREAAADQKADSEEALAPAETG